MRSPSHRVIDPFITFLCLEQLPLLLRPPRARFGEIDIDLSVAIFVCLLGVCRPPDRQAVLFSSRKVSFIITRRPNTRYSRRASTYASAFFGSRSSCARPSWLSPGPRRFGVGFSLVHRISRYARIHTSKTTSRHQSPKTAQKYILS